MNVLPIVNSTCLGINTLIIHVYRYHVSFCKFGKVLCYVLSFVVKILYFGTFHIIMSDLSLLLVVRIRVFFVVCCLFSNVFTVWSFMILPSNLTFMIYLYLDAMFLLQVRMDIVLCRIGCDLRSVFSEHFIFV